MRTVSTTWPLLLTPRLTCTVLVPVLVLELKLVGLCLEPDFDLLTFRRIVLTTLFTEDLALDLTRENLVSPSSSSPPPQRLFLNKGCGCNCWLSAPVVSSPTTLDPPVTIKILLSLSSMKACKLLRFQIRAATLMNHLLRCLPSSERLQLQAAAKRVTARMAKTILNPAIGICESLLFAISFSVSCYRDQLAVVVVQLGLIFSSRTSLLASHGSQVKQSIDVGGQLERPKIETLTRRITRLAGIDWLI